MRPSKSHGFVAWLIDLYVFAVVMGALVALTLAIRAGPGGPVLGLGLFGLAAVLSIGYHVLFAARTAILSPGEMVAGRFVRSGGKVWLSPYSRTRWPLYLVVVATAVLLGNTWDGITDGAQFELGRTLGQAAVALTLIYCLVLVGQGRPWALAPVAAYWGVIALGSLAMSVDAQVATAIAVTFGAMATFALLSAVLYARWRLPLDDRHDVSTEVGESV